MSKKNLFRVSDGMVAYLEMHSTQQILRDKGMLANGSVQAFHTMNVLRRIIKYMPMRSGMTVKVTEAQTNINSDEIPTDVPYGQYLYHGVSASGNDLNYTKTLNPQAGPYWDRALAANELPAITADLQRYIDKRGK